MNVIKLQMIISGVSRSDKNWREGASKIFSDKVLDAREVSD
jgi:hypothetical protein